MVPDLNALEILLSHEIRAQVSTSTIIAYVSFLIIAGVSTKPMEVVAIGPRWPGKCACHGMSNNRILQASTVMLVLNMHTEIAWVECRNNSAVKY